MQFRGLKLDKQLILLIAAFAAIYVVWGSTYLAIKYAIETMPPFLMAGTRFVVAGGLLYLWARMSPDFEKPTAIHWRTSLIVGALLLVGGNGGVVYAQAYIPSSLAALLVAVEPFWIVLLSWLWLRGGRPTGRTALGLLVGFAGVAVLITGQGGSAGPGTFGGVQLLAMIAVVGAALAWAAGSIYGLKSPVPKSALLTSGMQMLSGGALLLVISVLSGELGAFQITQVSQASWLGLAYLTIFGSIIGFTAYSWLLKNASPSRVATYAYVNPVVAVLLGWLIGGESLTMQMLVGAVIVVGSVMLITSKSASQPEIEAVRPTLRKPDVQTGEFPSYSTN